MSSIDEIRAIGERFHGSLAESMMSLRLSLSSLLIDGMNRKRWTARQLAAKSKVREEVIREIVYGDRNWTTSTAARLLYALDFKDVQLEVRPQPTTDHGQQPPQAAYNGPMR